MCRIAADFDEFPQSLEIPLVEHDVEEGYTGWASSYDGPNPAIDGEEPIVHAMLDALPIGDALDAACGTGRHVAKLLDLGHRVIGVDTTQAMLDIAQTKCPGADLRRGRLEQLPVDSASVDLVTCSLALTHVPELGPVIAELARVLRPGGVVVLSDIHPFNTMLGGSLAAFPGDDITKGIPFVRNRTHLISTYIAGFRSAALRIDEYVEVPVGERQLTALPSYSVFPDATRQAMTGIPYLLIWRVTR
jgi:ubiquinone/menaquinone biosynthesis C-methylase UbiE